MDVYYDEHGRPTYSQDSMGVVQWFLEGPGELDWPYGQRVTYTAPIWRTNTCTSVYMVAHDSGTKGIDSPVIDQVAFTIRVPESVRAWFQLDSPLYTPGPPDNSMRACSVFGVQILPDTVNFVWVDFREHIEPQTFPWPNRNKTPYVRTADDPPLEINDVGGAPNCASDPVSTGGPWDVERLLNVDTQQYEGRTFNVVVPLQFFAEDQWNEFVRPVHPRDFSVPDFKAKVRWVGGESSAEGHAQGPYREAGN